MKLRLNVLKNLFDHIDERASFSRFYSGYYSSKSFVSVNQLLPILPKSINTPVTVIHCAKIIVKSTKNLDPSQVSIITADPLVYALGKHVQWLYPHEFGNAIWMMRPLHIEMMFLNINGTWLDGTGWSDLYEKLGIDTSGRVCSFLKGSHLKRSRYPQQITLVSLAKLAHQAYLETDCSYYDDWKKSVAESSNALFYWFHVIELQLNLFLFIRSIRKENFDLFVHTVDIMLSWASPLDHINYVYWMSVFICDLKSLYGKDAYNEFCKGHITVEKSNRAFYGIGEDHSHERNNKIIKADGGAIGIFDHKEALLE